MTARRLSSLASMVLFGLLSSLLALLGQDLFLAMPLPVLNSLRVVAFLGLSLSFAVVARLLRVRPGVDTAPGDDRPGPPSQWAAWTGLVAVSALAIPLLRHPGNFGFGDWDLFLGKYEAARRTIVIWGQFPWWDPWTRGGFPLAANPQCGVGGLAMPLVLAFGTSVGMRLATLACFLLAIEGARRLARLWIDDEPAATLAGLIYGLNGGVLVASVAAYHVAMCYPALPWMLYHIFRLERRRSDGFWLGFWTAFNILNGIQYFTVYTVLIAGVAWLHCLVARAGATRRRFLAHTMLSAGIFLGLSGWRLATTLLVYRDFPRAYPSGYAETPWSILVHLLNRPPADILMTVKGTYFWGATCYIGPVVLTLAVISVRGGWRWWHTLALLCGWLASGSVGWYYPSYWLKSLPVFSTMHDVTRWRFMAMLGVALAAASVVAAWRKDGRPGRRLLANLAMLAIVADYLAYGYEVLPVAFSIAPREDRFPGPELPAGEVVQVKEWLGFPAVLRGHGVICGFEPLMGYDRLAATERRFRGGPSYVGEHWTARGPARVVSWSPNRIVLEVEPREVVYINQNPGSWWWVNGRPAFEGMRCAEKQRTFAVVADDRGRVILEIRPRGLKLGLTLHLVGAALVFGTWIALRRPRRGAMMGLLVSRPLWHRIASVSTGRYPAFRTRSLPRPP
jgi:hypothetical protein